MTKALILAEKPSQARDIAHGLGGGFTKREGFLENRQYVLTWAFGHLVSLQNAEAYDPKYTKWNLEDLPIIPDKFKYMIPKEGSKQFKVIKNLLLSQDVDKVVISTDPGREGELIARLILMMAGNKKPVYRFWTSKALVPEAVQEGFRSLRPASDFDRIYQSALVRQCADWLVGINYTRALTAKLGELFSVGRVQTPTLALIVRREGEIQRFKPQGYWNLKAKFRNERGEEYEGIWIHAKREEALSDDKVEPEESGEEGYDTTSAIAKEELATRIQAEVAGRTGEIESALSKVKQEKPPLLFSLTVLQQEANKLYGFTADKTLQLAQNLYERHHAITYPRSDSQHLNEELAKECPAILKKLTKAEVPFDSVKCTVAPHNKRVFDSSKLTDHHALIPTGELPRGPSQDESKLYTLIVKRFIAAFYPDFKYNATVVFTQVNTHLFKSSGKTIIDQGWKEVFGSKDRESILPKLEQNDTVRVIDAKIEQKQTTPPPRYTDAGILKAMTNAQRFVTDEQLKKILRETAGLGTPATRAGILETLTNRGYIQRKGKAIVPMEKGIYLIKIVEGDKIADVAYTALWEQELDVIAEGKAKGSDAFMEGIRQYTREIIEKVKGAKMEKTYQGDTGSTGRESLGKCPECGSDVYESPKSFSCSAWKEKGCKFTLWKNGLEKLGKKSITVGMAKDLLSGKNIKLNKLKSKAGKEFDAEGKLAKDEQYGWKVQLVFGEG